jgi:3-deoxy-7-phosphoheptulonate synthase
MNSKIENLNIISQQLLPTPEAVKQELPLSERAEQTVLRGREAIEGILSRADDRMLLVVGPCAIHDVEAGLEYARRLRKLADEVSDTFLLVMRVYFEKPRTTTGWKGLINDPHMDDSFRIDEGLRIARKLLLDIGEIGLPVGTEALDPIVPQYLSDLVSWTAIGARTTESQTHREMASGLSMPVGFKNGTDGNIQVAVNAVKAASVPHRFLGINKLGQSSVFHTRGNSYGHVVLRGGIKPNYDAASVRECEELLKRHAAPLNIVIDCSHGNSLKDPARQPLVFDDCIRQVCSGTSSIVGMMVESNLGWGRQDLVKDRSKLTWGVSITDPCIDWDTTDKMIKEGRNRLRAVKPSRSARTALETASA